MLTALCQVFLGQSVPQTSAQQQSILENSGTMPEIPQGRKMWIQGMYSQ